MEKKELYKKPRTTSFAGARRKPAKFANRGFSGNRRENMKTTGVRLEEIKVPELKDGDVRVLAIGGFEEVGRNMLAIEKKDEIFIFDAGFEFTSDYTAPGIDFSLPNTKYLVKNKEKIKALIITHGHLDHIGGIPYMLAELGNPEIYTRNMTMLLIKKRMEEFPEAPTPSFVLVEPGDSRKLGETSMDFFEVTHSIPDSMGISIKTDHGNIIVTGDLKLRHENGVPVKYEEETWGKLSKEKNILMISDSTNCENPGWSIQEKTIHENVEKYMKDIDGRIIIATFASQFERMIAFVKAAENLGKKIVLEGRSIKTNMDIAKTSGYFTAKKDTIIGADKIDQYPSNRIVVISTGGQGEEFAALPRMSRGDHKYIKLSEKDTIILSSSVIPGNEISVRLLLDNLSRHDLKIIHYKTSDVHSTGHGNAEELKWIIKKVNPTFFVPGYGYHSMLKEHKRLAIEAGISKENIFVPDNGSVIDIKDKKEAAVLKEKIPSSPLMVDGFSVSEMQKAVISDRKILSKDGFINVVILINVSKKTLQKSPDVLSRGFVYLRESQNLLGQTRSLVSKIVEKKLLETKTARIDVDEIKYEIGKTLERFFLKKTNKKPLVMPLVLVI